MALHAGLGAHGCGVMSKSGHPGGERRVAIRAVLTHGNRQMRCGLGNELAG